MQLLHTATATDTLTDTDTDTFTTSAGATRTLSAKGVRRFVWGRSCRWSIRLDLISCVTPSTTGGWQFPVQLGSRVYRYANGDILGRSRPTTGDRHIKMPIDLLAAIKFA